MILMVNVGDAHVDSCAYNVITDVTPDTTSAMIVASTVGIETIRQFAIDPSTNDLLLIRIAVVVAIILAAGREGHETCKHEDHHAAYGKKSDVVLHSSNVCDDDIALHFGMAFKKGAYV